MFEPTPTSAFHEICFSLDEWFQEISCFLSPRLGVGELMKDENVKHKPYKNIYKSVQSIIKAEGIRGLQKGLSGKERSLRGSRQYRRIISHVFNRAIGVSICVQ